MNLPVTLTLGALVIDLPKQNRSFGTLPNLLFSDLMVIIGVGLALLLVLAGGIYGWVRLRRRRRRHVSGGQKVYRGSSETESEEIASALPLEASDHARHGEDRHHDHSHGRRRYKYRVRRRTHRARNPTLSETGGLPPSKSEEPTKL